MTLATPVLGGNRVLVSSFYNGSMLVENAGDRASQIWRGKSDSAINADGLARRCQHPGYRGRLHLRHLQLWPVPLPPPVHRRARLGDHGRNKRESRWASGFIVRHKDRYFINNDRGDLLIARLSPDGYHEISRTPLIKPTSNSGIRRELGAVNWSQPAEEIVLEVSLLLDTLAHTSELIEGVVPVPDATV